MSGVPGIAALLLCLFATLPVARADVAVAVVGSLSGPAAYHSVHSMEFAIDALNAKGGLLGQKVRMSFFDDSCDADQGEAAARRALDEHPSLIFGHNCSAPSIRAAPLYAAAGVIQITTQSTNVAVTEMNIGTLFRMIGRDDHQGPSAADLITKKWPSGRIAVIDDGEPFGKGLADSLRQTLAARSIHTVFDGSYTTGAPGYPDIVAAIARTKANVAYVAGYSEDIGLMLHELRAAGLTTQVLTGDAGGSTAVQMAAGPAVEGLFFSFPPDARLCPGAPALVAAAAARGIELDSYAIVNYAAVQVWAEAVTQAGSFDTAKVAEVLHKGRFDTVIGPVAFDAKGDIEGPFGEWMWYRWHNGKIEPYGAS